VKIGRLYMIMYIDEYGNAVRLLLLLMMMMMMMMMTFEPF